MSRPDHPMALVTGASRGIGLAIARALAPDHQLVLVARRLETLEAAAEELREGAAGHVHLLAGDLTTVEGRTAVLEATERYEMPIQVLVNNAGIATSAPLHRTDDERWAQALAINLTAPFALVRGLVPGMVEAGWGRIVNVASTAALKGYRYTSAYSASKAGVVGLTRALAVELAGTGVSINAVCPGFTDTDIVATAVHDISSATGRSTAQARKSLEKFSPQQRLLQPEEVASLVAYLVSDRGAPVNGQAIAIDGGETA